MANTITCQTCGTIVHRQERRIAGCGCDPDAPTWCYIDVDGRPRGLSAANWEQND